MKGNKRFFKYSSQMGMFIFLSLFLNSAHADENCYRLERDSKVRIEICIDVLKAPLGWSPSTITFKFHQGDKEIFHSANYAMIAEGQCLDCNKDLYSIIYKGPTSIDSKSKQSLLYTLNPIQFNGRVNNYMVETGNVNVGGKVYKYSKINTCPIRRPASKKIASL